MCIGISSSKELADCHMQCQLDALMGWGVVVKEGARQD